MSGPGQKQGIVGVCVVWGGAPPRLFDALRGQGLDVREAGGAADAVATIACAGPGRVVLVLVEPDANADLARALEVIESRWPRVEIWEFRSSLRARPRRALRAADAGRAVLGREEAAPARSSGRPDAHQGGRFPDVPSGAVGPSHLLTDAELAILLADEPRRGGGM